MAKTGESSMSTWKLSKNELRSPFVDIVQISECEIPRCINLLLLGNSKDETGFISSILFFPELQFWGLPNIPGSIIPKVMIIIF
jgi:hypothetical protein